MVDFSHAPGGGKGIRTLTDEVMDGFEMKDIKCYSCSGYGNCGYKSYFIKPEGGVASICMRRRKQRQCQRDGIEYSDDLLKDL